MAIETHTIRVTDDTTLEEVLDAADDGSARVERNGIAYTILRERETDKEDIWKDYDPQAVIEMLDDFERNPMDIDAKEWIAEIYKARREGSRRVDCP
jgi:hypothetical protein